MNQLQLFLPCAAGVEALLAAEVQRVTGIQARAWRAGVQLQASWRDALQLNLHSRLAQRVLIELQHNQYRSEQDLYNAAANVAWEIWFTPKQTFKVEITAQHSPLTSLNFAALKIKDAIADRFRAKFDDVRPSVDTRWPDVRVYVHLTTDTVTIYIDTSGEPLFKRGWREDKGDAPLKETLAAAMIAASGWDQLCKDGVPLYDPCCGSGTIAIEAAQVACNIAPGINRRFAFQKYLPFQGHVWDGLLDQAEAAITAPTAPVFGSDVSFRMVDFAERNAERAGVASTWPVWPASPACKGATSAAGKASTSNTTTATSPLTNSASRCSRTAATPEKNPPSRPRAIGPPTPAASRHKMPGARKPPISFRSWPRTGRKITRAGRPTCSRPTSSCPARCA